MRRLIRSVLCVGLCAATLTVAGPAAFADPPQPIPWSPEAAALAEEWRIPIAEAEARVDRQESAAAFADEATSALGDTFAGAWIDQANGGAVVANFAGAVPEDRLRTLAAKFGLDGVAVGRTVRYSAKALAAALSGLSEQLDEANHGARVPVSVALRTDANAVEVTRPDREPLTSPQESFLKAAGAKYGAALLIVKSDDVPQTTACTSAQLCDPPLRGGLQIHDDFICTSGFMVQSKVDTKQYVLTAGHCVADDGGTWGHDFANGVTHNIGVRHNWIFGPGGDMAIIHINNAPGWTPQPWVTVTAQNGAYPTTANNEYDIRKVSTSGDMIGEYVCKTGQTDGTRCGKVEALGVSVSYTGGPTVNNLGRAKVHLCKGDSGGPVFVKHRAYGLVSGGILSGSCGSTMFYQGVKSAAAAMNVNLLLAP